LRSGRSINTALPSVASLIFWWELLSPRAAAFGRNLQGHDALAWHRGVMMPQKFDPAPLDRHADKATDRVAGGEKAHELDKGLEDSFPASDPVSSAQPKKNKEGGD
jgi:hypothetical protein